MRVGIGSGIKSGAPAAGGVPPGKTMSFAAPTPAELAPKFPQLEILSLLGQGGMGAVYRARQKELDRIVALKILPPSVGQDAAFADRFTREARALARLNHPGIVTLYEFGRADGLFYFLMEYVDGVSLRQLLSAGRVAPREALAIVPQICDALQYAHDQNIVHRDIKPENILMDRRGRVKVADFGVSKLMGTGNEPAPAGAATLSGGTEAGKVVGTPHYMAPEQFVHPGEVDHRADIYALGIVFYQMLTGEMPGKPIEPPSHKVQIDVRLDEVVLRALEKDPSRRYAQASVLKTQVETIATTPSLETAMPPPKLALNAAAQDEPELWEESPQAASHLSRTALVGAAWTCLFVVAVTLVGFLGVPYAGGHFFPIELLLALSRFLLGLAVSAVVGVSILGCVAVVQVRRSAGRFRGLGLAVFESLCFPLLALDLVILAVFRAAIGPPEASGKNAFLVLSVALLALDVFIGRAIWRAAGKPRAEGGAGDAPAPRPVSRAFLGLAYGGMTLGVFVVTGLTLFMCGRLVDNIDLPFVDDPAVIGRWTAVDFVDSPEQFRPSSQPSGGDLYLKELVLLPGGKTPHDWQNWTKGVIIHKGDRTAAAYELKEIAGTNYMFLEWMTGDYSYSHEKPPYYVLRWSGSVTPTGSDSGLAPKQ